MIVWIIYCIQVTLNGLLRSVKPNKLNYSNVLGLTYEAVTELILKLVLTGRSLSIYIELST